MKYDNATYIAQTRCWLENVVLKHNLCPFAHKPFNAGQIRLTVTDSARPEFLLEDLQQELELLRSTPAEQIETTLLIHPNTLEDFLDYNDFLDVVEHLLSEDGYEGEFQVAHFQGDAAVYFAHVGVSVWLSCKGSGLCRRALHDLADVVLQAEDHLPA